MTTGSGERTEGAAEPAVEVHGLSFSYGRQPVLVEVELLIAQGDFVALWGPNGGGKSTLLKILAGILKPVRGQVRVLGRPPGQAPGLVGYVPQDVTSRPGFPITVLETVMMGRLGGGRWRLDREDRRRALEALERVGLAQRAGELVAHLSGGQRQRVYIARALAGDPRLLLLDEPASNLDQGWQAELFELLRELNRQRTIIMVSHDLGVISSHVKSVACVNRRVFYHPSPQITGEMLARTYQCPVELVAHGLPHRVLAEHHHPEDGHD